MANLTAWGRAGATAQERNSTAEQIVDEAWLQIRPALIALVGGFLASPPSPQGFLAFELGLLGLLRQFGRLLIDATVNTLEPSSPAEFPRDLWFEYGGYRRRNEKTCNTFVATLFGTITLWRRGYRSWDGDGSIFPLEMLLGLHQGVTPGLADWLGRKMAEAGASQTRVLELLREERGVSLGVKRLREVVEGISQGMAEFRQASQVDVLLAALETAQKSRGSRKPVLAVGRDGITLREYQHRFYEVATAATISVYDRAGKRLCTVYLAWPPEPGQETMTRMLTELLLELFDRWHGPLPRLAYVTDCGDHETNYFRQTLQRMVHPRTGERLHWQRVVDYYHVAERIWTMASALFGGQTREATAWARRMLKTLKKPSGPSRVLHSAASLFHRRTLTAAAEKEFWRSYQYLQTRTRFMRYHEYQSLHIPIGSGVTEAACKTVFTQRLKLSGMRWTFEGAKTVLNLRVILLSGAWRQAFSAYLDLLHPTTLRPYAPRGQPQPAIAP
jgi:hypothetical protein